MPREVIMNQEQCLHISYEPSNNWGYLIWNAINEAEGKNITPISQDLRSALSNLILAFSYKWDYLPIVLERLRENVERLYQKLQDRDKSLDKYALEIENIIKYELIIDVNSFFHELYSGMEILEEIEQIVNQKVLGYTKSMKIFSKILKDRGESDDWLKEFFNNRGHFTHAGTPWFAVSVKSESEYELLILKENVKCLDDPKKYVKFSDLDNYIHGFMYISIRLQEYLVKQIKEVKMPSIN